MKKLLSVGIDVGTTTTQLIFSHLTVENKAGAFSVPELHITEKTPIYYSNIHFTPLRDEKTIDEASLRQIVRRCYDEAGLSPEQVQTGAVIITGETARKENAEAIVRALAGLAGECVVATAGPALEGILAAQGAGADRRSETGAVVHFDIGGGTANLTLWQEGRCRSDGCLNVGGRLLRFNCNAQVTYISPVLAPHCSLKPGDRVSEETLLPIARLLVRVLEEAVGLRPKTQLFQSFLTDHPIVLPEEQVTFSFSGGVAELLSCPKLPHWLRFEDLGVVLAKALRESELLKRPHFICKDAIRATVLGAGNHAAQLSGSTVFCRGLDLPLHDLPVAVLGSSSEFDCIPQMAARYAAPPALYLNWQLEPHFPALCALAQQLAPRLQSFPRAVIVLKQDLAKALGFSLSAVLPGMPLLCLDSLFIPEGSYLDVAAPVDGAYPVVIKTLIFSS